MCLSSIVPMISFHDILMHLTVLTYHYARITNSLSCHVMCRIPSGDWHYEQSTWCSYLCKQLRTSLRSFWVICLFRLICTAFMSKLGGFLENFGRWWQSRPSIWFVLDSDRVSREDRLFDEFQQEFKPPTCLSKPISTCASSPLTVPSEVDFAVAGSQRRLPGNGAG